jgi:hypothetical protein
MTIEERNALIKSTEITWNHGCLTCWLHLDYGGAQQGFGGYALDRYDKTNDCRVGTVYGMEFIQRIMSTVGASWEKLPGKHCRARIYDDGRIHAIGHIIHDQWFNPEEDLKEFFELKLAAEKV